MKAHPWRQGLWAAVVLVALGGLWALFAPQVAGGQAAYVIVAGASMEPALHRGDLVITRRTGAYEVGDVVAYRHPTVGPVIHRIIAEQDGRYTLQGDANDWTDSHDPTAEDVLGEEWIRLPGAGRLLLRLREPGLLSLLALGISALVVSMVVPMKHKSTKGRGPTRSAKVLVSLASDAGGLQTSAFVLGLLSLLAILLAVPAWRRSLDCEVTRTLAYTQRGGFDYGARVAAGVYDSGTLKTGDPVYLRLNRTVSMRFDYEFAAEAPARVSGTTALRAEIRDVNGWHRTLVLQPPQPFAGTKASAFGVLDLDRVRKFVADLEKLTGVVRPFYTLLVLPEITVTGVVGEQPLTDVFAPRLSFQLDPLQMQLLADDPSASGANPVQPSASGTIEYPVTEPNRISLLGASLEVRAARWISGIGLLVGLGGLAVLAWLVSRAQRRDPDVSASMKYGAHIVDLQAGSFETGGPTLEVSALEDLARAATRGGTMIHRARGETGSDYFVRDGDQLYHYVAPRTVERPSVLDRS